MFYCSQAINVPLHEIRVQANREVVISEWTTTEDLIVNQIGYTPEVFTILGATRERPDFDKWERGKHRERQYDDPAVEEALKAYCPDPAIRHQVSNYLARMFIEVVQEGDEHLYNHSIAVTEMLLSGDDYVATAKAEGFGGLQYPTMQMSANGDNFALKLSFAEPHLAFVAAHHVLVAGLNPARTVMSWRGLGTAKEVTQDGDLSGTANAISYCLSILSQCEALGSTFSPRNSKRVSPSNIRARQNALSKGRSP
jgi:hypothetical protein